MGKIVDTMESIPGFQPFEVGSKKLLVYRESQFLSQNLIVEDVKIQ
jgi:hypothetical protein